jgi:hypothetical protein
MLDERDFCPAFSANWRLLPGRLHTPLVQDDSEETADDFPTTDGSGLGPISKKEPPAKSHRTGLVADTSA